MRRKEMAHLLIWTALAVAALVVLVGCGGAAPPNSGGTPGVVPPCVGAGCEPRDVSGIALFSGPANGAGYGPRPTPSVEDVLKQGLR